MQNHINWSNEPILGPMLRPREASAYLGVSVSHYYELVSRHELPPLVKLSTRARASGHPKSWLDKVLQNWAANSLEGVR